MIKHSNLHSCIQLTLLITGDIECSFIDMANLFQTDIMSRNGFDWLPGAYYQE
jgi:hypothetical protein